MNGLPMLARVGVGEAGAVQAHHHDEVDVGVDAHPLGVRLEGRASGPAAVRRPRRSGESATASATATARSVAASRASRRASTAASVRETSTSTTTTSPWSSRICRATDSSRTHRGTRTAAFLPRGREPGHELNDHKGDRPHTSHPIVVTSGRESAARTIGRDLEDQMSATTVSKNRTHYLYIAVIVAVLLGIAVGLVAPDFAVELKPLGTAFVGADQDDDPAGHLLHDRPRRRLGRAAPPRSARSAASRSATS